MKIHKEKLNVFISFLYRIDIIPRGSKLIVKEEVMDIGTAEGMALYLNGTELLCCIVGLVGCNNAAKESTDTVNRVIGYSALYSEELIGEAFDIVEKEFPTELGNHFTG